MSEQYGIVTGVQVKPAGAAIVVPATGGNLTIGSAVIPVHCVGQMAPYSSVTGPISASGRVDFIFQKDGLYTLALENASHQLDTFDVTIGTYKITTCKMTNYTLNAAVEGIIKGSFSFSGLVFSTGASNPARPTAVTGFKAWTMVATNLGTFEAVSVDLTIDNNVKAIHYMGKTSPSRNPAYLAEGFQTVKFNSKLAVIPTLPADITANALAPIATPVFTFTDNTASPVTATITFTNALAEELSQDLDPEDLLRYGLSYTAESVAFT